MPQSSIHPPPPAHPIISPQFCTPHPVDLSIVRKIMTMKDGEFVVSNIDGDILFKVKGKYLSLHDNRVLVDAAGNPLVTLRGKLMSAHDRWQAFRGESTDSKDLLFTVKRSTMFQWKTTLDVFLASNTGQKVCDFKVEGSWWEKSCTIYTGESSTIIAEMHKKYTAKSVLIGKDNFMVTVHPNVDYAFISALIVVLSAINDIQQRTTATGAASAAGAAGAVAAAAVV